MNLPRTALGLALGRRLPTTSGKLAVRGLDAPVTIRRDSYGVPHIDARTERDAWYAAGFCQGQDRAFQLEMMLRMVRGSVSALVGREGLAMDRLARRIGFQRSAETQYPALDAVTRETLAAFARGVTDGVTLGSPKRAHEFAILRAEPTPYQPTDPLALMKYLSLVLSPWPVKLARLAMLSEDGPDAVRDIASPYPPWQPVTRPGGVSTGQAITRLAEDLTYLTRALGLSGASNNWALAPSRTESGRPILANDPHLAPMAPSPWYLLHIRTPEWEAAGASLIGTPAFAIGHNEVAAWGTTAGLLDDIDLYLEEIGPDGRSVREGDSFVPCQVRQEFIQVKGGPPVEEKVLVTRRGPIVGPALDEAFDAISMSATWLSDRPAQGFLKLHRVRSFDEFREAFDGWPLASQNMVYADVSGEIGWQLAGQVPERSGAWGTLPLPGWEPDVCPGDRVVPFEDMPYLRQPESGYVATANNKPLQGKGGPYLGDNWLDGYRCARICQVLDEKDDWTLEETQRLQLDEHSTPWQEIREAVLAAPAETARARRGLELLQGWDGVVAAGSPAAAVHEFLLAALSRRIVEARAPRSSASVMGKAYNPLVNGAWFDQLATSRMVQLVNEQPEGWFETGWPGMIAAALEDAIGRLEAFGPEPEHWRWGEIRTLTLKHPLGEHQPFKAAFNLGPVPFGGDTDTVAQAKVWAADPASNPFAIPSLRAVFDVGDWDHNAVVLATGQSGNPLSPHYDDQFALWQAGEAMTMPWSEAAVRAATKATLALVPSREG